MNRNLQKLPDQRRIRSTAAQFSLRTLMLLMAFCAIAILVLRELTQRYGAVAAFVAVLAGLSIFAHLAGAAIGNQFRHVDMGDGEPESEQEPRPVHHQPLVASKKDFAPVTELSRQQPLVLKPIYWAVGLGASSAAILASIVLTLFMWDDLAIVNVVFGAFSAAVIGGILGFWVSSFYQVVRSALDDAKKDA